MKTVLMISPDVAVKGGISSVVKGLINTELSRKYRIILVSSHVDGSKFGKLIQAIVGLAKTAYYLTFDKIDIVHIHGSDPTSSKRKYIYFRLVSLFRCKTIYHFHGNLLFTAFPGLSGPWKRSFRELFEHTDVVISLSEHAKKKIAEFAPSANIVVVPNSIGLPDLDQGLKDEDQNKNIKLAFLGHIKEQKGIFDLLKVIKELVNDRVDLRLFVGGYGELDRLQREISVLGLKDRVEYLGWISEEKRDSLLRKTDIFVLPSYGEGMPMTILEAMSHAVPVVSTPVGGIPELVVDGETGYLVKPGDIEGLRKRILELISDEEKRKQFGNRGRQIIEKNHNLEINIQKIENIYNSL
jgi:glycosyltransferase involved in cell wall biosynthesis